MIPFLIASGIIGVAAVVAAVFGVVYGGRRIVYALKGEQYRPLLGPGKDDAEYEHQDLKAGADATSIRAILRRYQNTSPVERYARAGLNDMDACNRKTENLRGVLAAKFREGSLTWSKFSAGADYAYNGVMANCAMLANTLQVFDIQDYKRLQQQRRRATFRADAQLDEAQFEKLRLFQEKLDYMATITHANNALLLELDKLTEELNTLDNAGLNTRSERLLEEIRTLSDETKYYRTKLDEMD